MLIANLTYHHKILQFSFSSFFCEKLHSFYENKKYILSLSTAESNKNKRKEEREGDNVRNSRYIKYFFYVNSIYFPSILCL